MVRKNSLLFMRRFPFVAIKLIFLNFSYKLCFMKKNPSIKTLGAQIVQKSNFANVNFSQ